MARGRHKLPEIGRDGFELLDACFGQKRRPQTIDNRLQPNQHQPPKPEVGVQAPPEKHEVIEYYEPRRDRNNHESHWRVDNREGRRVVDGRNQHQPPKPRVVVPAPEKHKAMEYYEPRGDRNNHESNWTVDCREGRRLFLGYEYEVVVYRETVDGYYREKPLQLSLPHI